MEWKIEVCSFQFFLLALFLVACSLGLKFALPTISDCSSFQTSINLLSLRNVFRPWIHRAEDEFSVNHRSASQNAALFHDTTTEEFQKHTVNQFETDVEEGTPSKGIKAATAASQAFLSGLSYCVSSCCMILLNKIVLSSFKWEAQISLMLYQVGTLLIFPIDS